MDFIFRHATPADLQSLLALENQCFAHDRLTARSFRWMISRAHASLIVAQTDDCLMGYALLLFRRGTSLARLYSIAIAPQARGRGLAKRLLREAEACARARNCTCLRLEVRDDNDSAIGLYEGFGYRRFAQIDDYYQDHCDALRYQKQVLYSC